MSDELLTQEKMKINGENDKIFNTYFTREAAEKDDSWFPYIYIDVKCEKCGKHSGYMKRKWFGMFPPSIGIYVCENCNNQI